MEIKQEIKPSKKGPVDFITLTNDKGASVTLQGVGAGIQKIVVPDRDGNLADVVIGYDEPDSYFADGPCAGKTPGRYANRIGAGRLTIDDKDYQLDINNGPNHLHGGPNGWQNQIWKAEVIAPNRVKFTINQPEGTGGFPGNVRASVTYTWNDNNTLDIDYKATTDAPTVVNMTNHTYFNLGGHNAGTQRALSQLLKLNANCFLPTSDTQIPTGELAPVGGTPMDFRKSKPVGKDIKADFEPLRIGTGYDHCWAIDGKSGAMNLVATLYDPTSGRRVDITSDQPGAQVYTGNWLKGAPTGKDGYDYQNRDAVAIECQGFPDAPNHPSFPSQLLRPGDTYRRHIRFAFSCD